MATGTAGSTARDTGLQVIHYLRRDVTTADAATTIVVGTLPAGALIIETISGVYVSQAFNAGTNNRMDIGASTDSGTNNYATLLALGTIGLIELDELAATVRVSADTTISAYVDVTGTAATTGQATIIIAFVPDNDR